MSLLLSTAYLPPVQYLSKFLSGNNMLIEKHEHYQKQSYRNRCYIYGANGKQCLVIPVKKMHGDKMPIAEVEIDYVTNWQKIHLKSIESAYRLSAFYEYYADDFSRFYIRKTRFLFDWNMDLLTFLLKAFHITGTPSPTTTFEKNAERIADFRNSIHPKDRLNISDPGFNPLPYQQVFSERYGFISNLSAIDLLFNEGPMAREVLGKCLMQVG
ncbi:MAG: WbqC family protein [Bacteroidales bacterium]|nr:WbqC family protein [Bacteroidales bacterium]